MSSSQRLCAPALLLVTLLLAGCDGAKLCQPCERPPETVHVEVDWQKLASALRDAGVGGQTVTVWTDSVNVTVVPAPNPPPVGSQTVTVANWADLVEELKSIETIAARQSTHNIHHSSFTFRFAPPWFNADQRSLFTSYVVFPEEAKLEEWVSRQSDEGCPTTDGLQGAVCPDTVFYAEAMGPFLAGLSQCATDKSVELYAVGFASSTTLKTDLDQGIKDELLERYDNHIGRITARQGDCLGDPDGADDYSEMFNLLIANERAVNVAAMLRDLVPHEPENAFDIKAMPWCAHASMEEKRKFNDHGETDKGLMNRRVEVRLEALPGCLDVDPDRRISQTKRKSE